MRGLDASSAPEATVKRTDKRSQPNRREGRAPQDPPPAELHQRTEVLERLLDLAYDVSSYLRHQAQPTIRLSAALLLAASLAACSSAGGETAVPSVQPLTQEVRSGLPTQSGSYPVVANSITRDPQCVYQFSWLQPGASGGQGTPARVSLLRLAEADGNPTLEVPISGDPILHLSADTPIQLAGVQGGAATPTAQNRDYVYWRPFYVGGGYYGGYPGPRYYDPPSQTTPSTGTVDGSTASVAPRPAAERTFGASHAVSGRAGGAGAGVAAT